LRNRHSHLSNHEERKKRTLSPLENASVGPSSLFISDVGDGPMHMAECLTYTKSGWPALLV